MKPDELLAHLLATADDGHLSRSERRALRAQLEAQPLDERQRREVEAGLFEAAAAAMHDPRDRETLRWIEDVLGAMRSATQPGREPIPSRAWFGPHDPLAELLVSQLEAAQRSIDAAVFTITDDRIAAALLAAHGRGVRVRIVSDVDKAEDPGSDIRRLGRAGIPLRTDRGEAWMHHKFAVVDAALLINGSYNWTRAGSRDNAENFLVTADAALVRAYRAAFERLWDSLGPKG